MQQRVITREFVVLWLGQVVATMGVSMVQPLLPIFVKGELGAPPIGVALSFGGVGIASLFASPLLSRYGDRIGAKPFLVGGFLIYAVAGFGYLIAENWQTVVAFRILSGVGAMSIFSMAAAYAGQLAPRGREGELMGLFAVAGLVGMGTGPLMGGALSDAFGTDAAFGAMAVLLIMNAISMGLVLPPRPTNSASSRDAERIRNLSFLDTLRFRPTQAAMTLQAVSGFMFGAGASFLGVYVVSEEGLNTGSALLAGILFTSQSVASGLASPISGRLLADRFDRTKLVIGGMLAVAVWQLLIPALPATIIDLPLLGGTVPIAPWLLGMFVLMGLSLSVVNPSQQAIYVDVGRHIGMGAIMSLTQWTSNAGFLFGAVIAGTVIVPVFGLEAVFRYTGIVIILGVLVFALMMRRAQADMRDMRAQVPATED